MDMTRIGGLVVVAAMGIGGSLAYAKLPPPTPEQQEQAAQKKAKAAAEAEEQKAALAKVQDQIAANYIAAQQAKGITVTPTPLTSAPTQSVPSAAVETRPTEKAGAYNQEVTTQSAQTSAATGTPAQAPKNAQEPKK
jgi:hypothetical protein